jgi:hypothetical protein
MNVARSCQRQLLQPLQFLPVPPGLRIVKEAIVGIVQPGRSTLCLRPGAHLTTFVGWWWWWWWLLALHDSPPWKFPPTFVIGIVTLPVPLALFILSAVKEA